MRRKFPHFPPLGSLQLDLCVKVFFSEDIVIIFSCSEIEHDLTVFMPLITVHFEGAIIVIMQIAEQFKKIKKSLFNLKTNPFDVTSTCIFCSPGIYHIVERISLHVN